MLYSVHMMYGLQYTHFTQHTSAVMSHESNTCSVFPLQVCLCCCIYIGPMLVMRSAKCKDADMEKFLLSCDITTEAYVKWSTPRTMCQLNRVWSEQSLNTLWQQNMCKIKVAVTKMVSCTFGCHVNSVSWIEDFPRPSSCSRLE